MCSWSKAMQIRHNVSQLEKWLRDKDLMVSGAKETLEPLIQATQLLLQNKKTDEDAEAICKMCLALNTPQIVKLLYGYTPVHDFEERASPSFILRIERSTSTPSPHLNRMLQEQSQQMTDKMAHAVQETQQLETDLKEERSRCQNLLREHLRMEDKYDDLKEAMASSVRDTQSILRDIFMNIFIHYVKYVELEEGSRAAEDVPQGIAMSLILKLQKRLTELEQEKQSLRNELENKEDQFQRARARVRTPPPPGL
ncbi:hypothetical protein KUCAC02_004633 [Chaenocephalus aceratus]|uniref:Uncharacterized protein n=1 Tax=Chaenocephalus aceratus TaxID=36190 RepID=A0ACB9X0W3_CHAAC|nr:hypothetical protein KUCAC02_004633 [Chaenocephalus aceratus]